MKLLPTPNDGHPNTRVRVALSGSTYAIQWLWNERDQTWAFSMWDASGVPLVLGVRVVLYADLLEAVAPSERRPPHSVLVIDPSQSNAEPGRTDLGNRVKAVYMEPSE